MKKIDLKDPEHQIELNKGLDRIGNTPAARLDWVLRLVQTDLDDLSTGSRLDLGYEVFTFSVSNKYLSRSGFLPLNTPKASSSKLDLENISPFGFSHYIPFPTIETLKKVQTLTKSALISLTLNNFWVIDAFSIQRVIVWRDEGNNDEMLPVTAADSRLEQAFRLSLLMTLIAEGGRVRYCPRCGKFFRAGRRNQEFCSLTCQTRMATFVYRERHGLITGKPRGRPRKVVAKGKNPSKIKPSKTAKKGGSKSGTKTRKR